MRIPKPALVLLVLCTLMGAYTNVREVLLCDSLIATRSVMAARTNGKHQAIIASTKGGASLGLSSKKVTRVYLDSGNVGADLQMSDAANKTRFQINVGDDGKTALVLTDKDGKTVWGVWADKDGKVTTQVGSVVTKAK